MTNSMSPYQSFIATEYKPALHKNKDFTDTVVGGYLVKGTTGKTQYGQNFVPIWAVVCTSCYKLFHVQKYSVTRNTNGCSICAAALTRGEASPHWKGRGDVPGDFVSKLRTDRKSRKLDKTVTVDYLNTLWEQQQKKCAYTGWTLSFGTADGEEQTASLDRIDSNYGYVEGNVQFVHKDINRMKWDLSEDRFIELCAAIVNNLEK